MRRVQIQTLTAGNKLAKAILLENGNVLLGAGVELTDRFIKRLKTLGIESVYIEDDFTADIEPEETIRDETKRKAVKKVHKTLTDLMNSNEAQNRSSISDIGQSFQALFGEILDDIKSQKNLLIQLSNLNVLDGYLFHHSVNVAVLAGIIGITSNFNKNQLLELGVGALLFDIGMTKIPPEIISKTRPLSEEEKTVVEKHTFGGFDILRRQPNISLLSAHCALQHHERFDGTGYPRQLQKNDIQQYAQIVAIADFYDALISPRPHRKAYSPNEATEFLFAAGDQFFDYQLVQRFLKHIAIYPVSTTVLLSTGQVGVVSKVDPVAVHRPTLRIIMEQFEIPCQSPYELDLKKHHNIVIEKTL